ncbi:MAG: retropepsin-like aspartic protease family protein [Planctomycetota bacterium]
MALDTGARLSVISPATAEELGFGADDLEPSITVTGATGATPAAMVKIDSVSVLGLEVEKVRAICHTLPPRLRLDGILGLDYLKHFNITINHEAETVALDKWR